MLCTSGWLCLKSMSNLAVHKANMPRNTVRMTEGTIPVQQCLDEHTSKTGEDAISMLTDDRHRVWQCKHPIAHDLCDHESRYKLHRHCVSLTKPKQCYAPAHLPAQRFVADVVFFFVTKDIFCRASWRCLKLTRRLDLPHFFARLVSHRHLFYGKAAGKLGYAGGSEESPIRASYGGENVASQRHAYPAPSFLKD